ncbi:S8 family serine peptidase [Chachezhania sediminis]|uniref:S8 family serine peptidase n=1 Tax=Chachezhania sediminis TaxID=2599291 RepID=UPI001E488F5C|nr:S8 family serine peptidase [Chachezhania sediminis]
MTPFFPPLARMAAVLAVSAFALASCASFTLNPPAPEFIKADAGDVVDDREIVVLVPTTGAAAHLRKGAAAEGFVLRDQRWLGALGLYMQRYTIPEPLNGPGAIAALERIEPTSTAGVNHAYKPVAAASLDYANTLIAWPDHACRAAGPIGMIDTSVNGSIRELAGVKIVAESFARGGAAPDRHGTEVAAVLADPRRLSGVTLFSAAVIGESARGRDEAGVDSLLEALDWLAANGVRLVNISLAGPYNKLLDRGIDVAATRGMILVAAVGNDGATAAPRYPAALGNVIGVTAVDADKAIYRNAVRGSYVDVAAPGVDILLKVDGRTRFVTGTSIATPFVTARIASDPRLFRGSPGQIRQALGASSVDLGAPGRDPVFGAGLVVGNAACPG